MAPFRGRGSRGHRGGSRGGRGRGRGNIRGDSGKLARSGIRTRAGYRKFDSQRIKDTEADDSGESEHDEADDVDDISDSEEEEAPPTLTAYQRLLKSFQVIPEKATTKTQSTEFRQPLQNSYGGEEESERPTEGRERKRRKVEAEEQHELAPEENGEIEAVEDSDGEEEEDGVLVEGDGDEDGDNADPFEVHFANPDDNELSQRLKSVQADEWTTEKQDVSKLGTFTVSAPKSMTGTVVRLSKAWNTDDMPLKKRLAASARKHLSSFNNVQRAILPYICNYADLLVGNRTPDNAASLRNVACLHALNHVLKGRDKVLKNNTRLSHAKPEDPELELRDQGYTRPKVLILLETRQMCAKYASSIVDLFEPEQQDNKQRFKNSFEDPISDDHAQDMPEDYRELFEGNNDNDFLTALKLTRKTLKFYSPFYTSDIIIASPLGLRRVLENEDVKKRDHDFLSSIELLIVDQADAMFQQNWENVEIVLDHMNLPLKEAHGCDFSRVRNWYLDDQAKYLRQTVVFSAYITPKLNQLFIARMLNVAGKAKLKPTYRDSSAAIFALSNLSWGIKQTFSRFPSPLPIDDPDARFKFFTTAIMPSLLRLPKGSSGGKGILLFIPSYFDYLRVRNFFAFSGQTSNISWGSIHEYSPVSSQRRSRAHFRSGRISVLLYTQRAHHFFRLRIKGVRNVFFYGLPDNPLFYEEVTAGFLGTSVTEGKLTVGEGKVRSMFSKWEGFALERVVGSARVRGMLREGGGDQFEFE